MTLDTLPIRLATETVPDPRVALSDPRVYWRTSFRLDTPSYRGPGWEAPARDAFTAEIGALLGGLGFVVTARHGWRVAEDLYAHPHELTGYVVADSLPAILDAFQAARTTRIIAIDRYGGAYMYTPDEYRTALDGMRASLASMILEHFRTPRRNLYRYDSALEGVRSGLPHIGRGGGTPWHEIEWAYLRQLFQDLTTSGQIIRATDKRGTSMYRTAKQGDPGYVA